MTVRISAGEQPPGLHWPCLLGAMALMLAGTFYPPLLTGHGAKIDHVSATLLLCGMSLGFVRGVGLVPVALIWRGVFSSWACAGCLLLAALLRMLS